MIWLHEKLKALGASEYSKSLYYRLLDYNVLVLAHFYNGRENNVYPFLDYLDSQNRNQQ